MKMSRFEKRFINAAGHSRRVAKSAEQRLPIVPYRALQARTRTFPAAKGRGSGVQSKTR